MDSMNLSGQFAFEWNQHDYEVLAIDNETYVTCMFPKVPLVLYDADSTLEYCTICNVLASVL